MAILTFHNLSKEFGGEYVFGNISGSIDETSRIGIVGPNGIGKTTLLKLIAGKLEPSTGTVAKGKSISIGFLHQEAIQAFADDSNTVFEEMLHVFEDLRKLRKTLRDLEANMSESSGLETLLEEYGTKLHAFEAAGGYEFEHRIKRTLSGLGFSESEFSMLLAHCSGGQQTRALLGRLLLEEADLLIMDEPTNHLDSQAVDWLEETLRKWEKAVAIVSHDRYFLDRTVDRIWEMNIFGIERYKGNYSAYTLQRAERRERREKTFNATLDFFYSELHFIRRFIESKTEQAKGRMKRLIRHVKAVEIGGPEALEKQWNVFLEESGGISNSAWSVDELEWHIQQLKCQNPYTAPMRMRIHTTRHLPDLVVRARNAKIGYPGNTLFEISEVEIRGRQRAALVGPNGSGKSTFLRSLLGKVPIMGGTLELAETIRVGYFAQAHDTLNPDDTVVETLMSRKPEMLEAEARNYLGAYLFSNDDVYKLTRNLSGGERGRLTLAILALERINLLVLDEPTNHLDIQSREILEEALLEFGGTILLVTHDRYLIEKVATHIWDILDGRLTTFDGTYENYLEAKTAETRVNRRSTEAQTWRRSRTEKAEADENLDEIEAAIETLEAEIRDLGKRLETAVETRNDNNIKEWKERYLQKQEELEVRLRTWERVSASS